ncbi:potassium channel family protein [Streptomyces sp. YIM S03343]
MSDPTAVGPDRDRSGPDAHGPRRQPRPGRRAVAEVVGRAVLISAGLVTAYYLLPYDERTSAGAWTLLVLGLTAVVLVFLWEIRIIVHSPYPRLKAVEVLATTLVLFLVLFAAVYELLDHSTPETFSERLTRTDALYFTLTTFSTVGYGDITARTEAGRVVVMAQMTVGLLLVGVAVRVLVSAVEEGLRRRQPEPPEQPEAATDTRTPDREAES